MSGGTIYRCPCGRLLIHGQTCTCGNNTSRPGVVTTTYGEVYRDGGNTCECPPPGGDES